MPTGARATVSGPSRISRPDHGNCKITPAAGGGDNAAMNESGQQSNAAWRGQRKVWALVGAIFLLSGAGNVHHGVSTLDYPFNVSWVNYLTTGKPQIVSGAAQILLALGCFWRAIVRLWARPV
jgi:hypothetical protein